MGLRTSRSGMVVQFFDRKNKPQGSPVYGAHVAIRGLPREKVATPSAPLKDDEVPFPGSDDWLTTVVVADTAEKLNTIMGTLPRSGRGKIPNTSAASRRVLVHVDVGKTRKVVRGRITIADGKVLSTTPPRMQVILLKVLAEGSRLTRKHPMFEEFQSRVPFPR